MNPTLKQVQEDWRLLDAEDFTVPPNVRIITNEQNAGTDDIPAHYIFPNRFVRLFAKCRSLFQIFYALQILYSADKNTVIIMNGGIALQWFYAGYFNRFFVLHRRIMILRGGFLEYRLGRERRLWFFPFFVLKIKHKESIARGALLGYDLISVWSKKQAAPHAEVFGLPLERMLVITYKANHSKAYHLKGDAYNSGTYDIPMSDFIFAGGNGKRDYQCLINAVRDTGIPVIISATDPTVRKTLERLPNVILLGAPEPAFAQLQAASRLVVVPMINSGLKGGGEANFCNAMWHSKPVIAADTMAAEDYIIEGETGYVVPSGDSEGLRKRILELWNDPEKCSEMGHKGRLHCEKYFRHITHMRRFLCAAAVLWQEKNK
ncbi:MAG: glycosyltransferase [Planctomycetaceae bacterium]|jgi:glycosyltransferase involved in cell wall biosynthesis|nr:glycosyltransferase [Planctomycetaceae bacterium]